MDAVRRATMDAMVDAAEFAEMIAKPAAMITAAKDAMVITNYEYSYNW